MRILCPKTKCFRLHHHAHSHRCRDSVDVFSPYWPREAEYRRGHAVFAWSWLIGRARREGYEASLTVNISNCLQQGQPFCALLLGASLHASTRISLNDTRSGCMPGAISVPARSHSEHFRFLQLA